MTNKRFAALSLVAFFVTSGESCADLPSVERGTCGNRVIDQGEECDTFAGEGQRCRAAEEANACRFDCKTAVCPGGFACNTNDGVCRKPTGTFSDGPSITFEANASRVTIADFDGDARGDVMAESPSDEAGRGSVRVFFLDDPAQAPKVTALAATVMSPTAHDMDRDGRADIAFSAFEIGVNVLLGRDDRTFAPVAFPRFPFPERTTARFVRLDGVKNQHFGVPLIFADPGGDSVVALGSLEGDPTKAPFALLPKPPSQVVVEPIAANIVDGVNRECDEVIWSWQGENTLQWIAPCGAGDTLQVNSRAVPQTLLSLPPGEELVRPPVAVDVNGDDHVDLLLGGKLRSYIAFGRGDATFSARPDLTGTASLAELECQYVYGGEEVGAANDCSGAALAGYARDKTRPWESTLVAFPNVVLNVTAVAPNAGLGGRVTLRGVPIATRSTGQWTTAIAADFNGNGYVDVVAASSGASDIDFFNGTPYGLVNPSKLTTNGPVARLSGGDFDGDLIRDLAFVELDVGGENIDGISVAYGRFMSPPERGLRMGVFPNIRQLGAAKVSGFDALEQIGVIYSKESDQLAVLEGAGDRQLLSPFGLAAQRESGVLQMSPYLNVAGQFDDDKSTFDLVVLGYDDTDERRAGTKPGPLRFWVAPGAGGGRFGLAFAGDEVKSFDLVTRDPLDSYRVSITARAVAADLDGDGKDEIITLAPRPQLSGALLTVSRVKGKTIETAVPLPIGLATPAYRRMELQVADIDGDGKLDAVVLLHALARSSAFVAWGSGTSFDTAGATEIVLPTEAGRAHGFAVVQLDSDRASELAFATSIGVFAVNATNRTLAVARLGLLPPADTIAAGDVDADGIADLALANGHRIGIHLGGASNP